MIKRLLLSTVVFAAFATSAQAQWHFGANIGLASPGGDIKDVSTTGFALNISLMNQFRKSPALSGGFRFHYMGYGVKDAVYSSFILPIFGGNDISTSFTVTSLMLALEVGVPKGPVQPFIGISAGPQFMTYTVKVVTKPQTYSDVGFGFAPQLGLRFRASERLGIEFRVAIHQHGKFEVNESGAQLSAAANGIEVGLGIRCRL